MPRRHAPSLVFVLFIVFLDALGIGLLIPIGPRLIAFVEGVTFEGAEHKTSLAFGSLMATYAAMQFLFSPLIGSLSDRFGRRPVLLIALLGSGMDYFVGAMAPNLAILFVTRAINGLTGATMPVCQAYTADVTAPEKRAVSYGMMFAAFGLGFTFGPLIGGFVGASESHLPLIGHGDVRYPYVLAGILTIASFLFGVLVLPESLPADRRRAFSWSKANPLGALKWLTHHPVVMSLAAALLLLNTAQYGLHSTWVLSMTARFHWNAEDAAVSMFVVGICAFVVQGGLARKIIPKLGERVCLLAGITLATFAYTGYGLATHGWMVYLIIAIASIGGVAGPSAQSIMTKAIGPTEQGLLQGALGSLSSLAAIVGPLAGTAVFRAFTPPDRPAPFPGAGAPFVAGAVLSALAIVPILMIWSRMPRRVQEAPIEGPMGGPAAADSIRPNPIR